MKFYLEMNMAGETLISHLARQGNTRAVNLLLAHGGSVEQAIYGYAWGKHDDQVSALMKSHSISCIPAIQGYARGNHFIEANKLVGPVSKLKNGLMKSNVYGLAQGQMDDVIANYLTHHWETYADTVIEGYASIGQFEKIKHTLKGTRFYSLAIMTAARCGQFDAVEQLLKQCNIDLSQAETIIKPLDRTRHKLVEDAMVGYVKGRHFKKAAELIEIGVQASLAITTLQAFPNSDALLYRLFLAHFEHNNIRKQVMDKILQLNVLSPFSEQDLNPGGIDKSLLSQNISFEILEQSFITQKANVSANNQPQELIKAF